MKVGIFTDSFMPAMDGVVRSTCLLVDQLLRKGVKVVIFVPGKESKTECFKGAEVHHLKGRELFFYPKYFFTIPYHNLIKNATDIEDIDLFHIQDPFMIGLAGLRLAKRMKRPVVGTYHTFFEEYTPHLTKGHLKRVVKFIMRWPTRLFVNKVYSKCDITIAPSHEIKDYLHRYGVNNVTLIPTGVDLNLFRRCDGKSIRDRYKIPRNAFVLIYAGRVSFEKKIEVLLRAFKMFKDKNTYLIIAGHGPSLEFYKEKARELQIKNVVFTGYLSDKDLVACYCCSDVFVSPSDTETQGLTFLEAMACGLPVIGAGKMGSRSSVSRSTGLLFKPMDVSDLYNKMNLLFKNRRMRLRFSRGALSFVKKFSAENFGQAHLELYRRLIKKYKTK